MGFISPDHKAGVFVSCFFPHSSRLVDVDLQQQKEWVTGLRVDMVCCQQASKIDGVCTAPG